MAYKIWALIALALSLSSCLRQSKPLAPVKPRQGGDITTKESIPETQTPDVTRPEGETMNDRSLAIRLPDGRDAIIDWDGLRDLNQDPNLKVR